MDAEASDRTRRLLGDAALARLAAARALVFGLGALGLVDCDAYAPSNLNRQLFAVRSAIGRRKTEVARERVLDIAPDCRVETWDERYCAATAERFDLAAWDAVVDAIDQVPCKLLLVRRAAAAGARLYSCMGGGNKLDPEKLRVTDLAATNRCPLAKVMRKKLRPHGIEHLPVVASDEEPRWPFGADPAERVQIPGTLPTVVGTAGLLLAHAVLRDLIGAPAAPLACNRPR